MGESGLRIENTQLGGSKASIAEYDCGKPVFVKPSEFNSDQPDLTWQGLFSDDMQRIYPFRFNRSNHDNQYHTQAKNQ